MSRKDRKARFIRAKNLMRKYPDCAYGGDFYCDHLYDPVYPWLWIDFRFFHPTKQIYYPTTLITGEYDALDRVESAAILALDEDPRSWKEKHDTFDSIMKNMLQVPQTAQEHFRVERYDSNVHRVFGVLNKPHIDEHAIREFIAFFRSFNHPKPGFEWRGEEFTVDVKKFENRHH